MDYKNPPSAPPEYYDMQNNTRSPTEKQIMLDSLAVEYDINKMFKDALWQINEKHIIVLCDDSGSMNTQVDGTKTTRWNELCKAVNEILKFAMIFDPIGMDIHFLNRPGVKSVTSVQQIENIFSSPPNGLTPLVSKLESITQQYKHIPYGKLLIIATDGEPSDDSAPSYNKLSAHIDNMTKQGYNISFLICTDRDEQVAYLNAFDKKYSAIDVVDDYITESNEVKSKQGRRFKFSYGDYLVKLLVGSVDPVLNELDEVKINTDSANCVLQPACNIQ